MRASSFFGRVEMIRACVVIGALALSLLSACNNARRATATCTPACNSMQMCCTATGGTTASCVYGNIDPLNCGGCGTRCGTGQTCFNGACTGGGADTGVRPPDSGMVTPDSGIRPDTGPPGMCTPTCAAGTMCCGSSCVDADGIAMGDGRSDPSFDDCGICGVSCSETSASRCGRPRGATSGRPVCLCGDFTACAAPRQCTLSGGSYRCIDPLGDDTACGAGAVDCTLNNETCEGGVCTCAATGSTCGALLCGDTGCIDINTDVDNCGAIGRQCNDGETCSGGVCRCGTGMGCDPPTSGTMGIGGSCGELCCAGACVSNDVANCGTCGTTCSGTDVCGTETDLFGMGGVDTSPHCGDPEGGGGFSFFMECAEGGTGTPCIIPGFPPGCV